MNKADALPCWLPPATGRIGIPPPSATFSKFRPPKTSYRPTPVGRCRAPCFMNDNYLRNREGKIIGRIDARIHVGDTSAITPGTVCIPLSALVTLVYDGNSQASLQTQLGVFVIKNGKAAKRAVNTGDILNSSIQVTEGLRPGETVVISGASFLYDGAPVESQLLRSSRSPAAALSGRKRAFAYRGWASARGRSTLQSFGRRLVTTRFGVVWIQHTCIILLESRERCAMIRLHGRTKTRLDAWDKLHGDWSTV